MIEKDVVFSNPVSIDDDTIQFDKTCKVVVNIASVVADKALYGLKLDEISKILDVSKGLL